MFDRGWDLLDYFRGVRPWPQLLRLLNRLPRHSHYKAAIADDEELAVQALADPRPARKPSVPLTEYSSVVELLSALVDGVAEMHATLIAAKYGKRPKVTHALRPVTAVMRVEKQRSMDVLRSIEDRMLRRG